MATCLIREASGLLGASADTLRRWADDGRIETITDASGRLAIDGVALAKLSRELAGPAGHRAGQAVAAHPARRLSSTAIGEARRAG
jgi:hypothetical protein